MYYWFLIIIGVIILSASISNPFYKLTLKKYFSFRKIYYEIFFRFFLFIVSIIFIFLGLYIESYFTNIS